MSNIPFIHSLAGALPSSDLDKVSDFGEVFFFHHQNSKGLLVSNGESYPMMYETQVTATRWPRLSKDEEDAIMALKKSMPEWMESLQLVASRMRFHIVNAGRAMTLYSLQFFHMTNQSEWIVVLFFTVNQPLGTNKNGDHQCHLDKSKIHLEKKSFITRKSW